MTSNQQMEEERRQKFYEKFEKGANCKVSDTLKNILRYELLDQPKMLANFDGDYASIETFVRSDAYKNLMVDPNDEAELEKFYGAYWKTPHEFRFTKGLKLQLEAMIAYVKAHPKKFKMPVQKQETSQDNLPDVKEVEEPKLLNRLSETKAKMDSSLKEKMKDVSVTTVYTGSKGLQAKLLCPLCVNEFIASKDENVWSISNFIKHLKKCDKKSRKRKEPPIDEDEEIDVENDSGIGIALNSSMDENACFSPLARPEARPLQDYNRNSLSFNDRANKSQNLTMQQYRPESDAHYGYSEYGYGFYTDSGLHNNINKDYTQVHSSMNQDVPPEVFSTPLYHRYETGTSVDASNENEGFYSAIRCNETVQYENL